MGVVLTEERGPAALEEAKGPGELLSGTRESRRRILASLGRAVSGFNLEGESGQGPGQLVEEPAKQFLIRGRRNGMPSFRETCMPIL